MYYKKYILYLTVFWFILVGCVPLHYSKARGKTSPGIYHTIHKGETLWSIAKTYKVSLKRIAEVNNLADTAFIKVGRKLFIPGATEVKEIKMPALVSSLSEASPYEEESADIATETAKPVAPSSVGGTKDIPGQWGYGRKARVFVWPVKGKITRYFGTREQKRHLGIDIKASIGTPVVAAQAGKVIYSGSTRPEYGNVVIIEHDRDFSTVYAHNSVNLVRDGIMVQKKQIIAYVGNTGRSTAPHLHFELRRRGRAENPLNYLPH